MTVSRPVGGVLFVLSDVVAIHLSGLPGDCPRGAGGPPMSHVRPCSGWGLPSRPSHPGRWCALTAPFHPCLCGLSPTIGGAGEDVPGEAPLPRSQDDGFMGGAGETGPRRDAQRLDGICHLCAVATLDVGWWHDGTPPRRPARCTASWRRGGVRGREGRSHRRPAPTARLRLRRASSFDAPSAAWATAIPNLARCKAPTPMTAS